MTIQFNSQVNSQADSSQVDTARIPTARDEILNRLRSERTPDLARYSLPEVSTLGDTDASQERFEANLQLMGGNILSLDTERSLEDSLRLRFPQAESFCSAVPEVKGTLSIHDVKTARQADKIDVMIVRAAFGIAETGSVFVSERELQGPCAYVHLAQHLVVLLSPQQVMGNMHTAYQERREFHEAGYGVLMSGPSATADIQGVLIRGAQGVRSLSVLWAGEQA